MTTTPSSRRWKRFWIEVLFRDPAEVPRAIEALAAADCEFEYDPDIVDDYGPAVFGEPSPARPS